MKVLRIKQVVEKTGLSKVSIWRLEREGKFPSRVQIGKRSVGWKEHLIDDWIKKCPLVKESGSYEKLEGKR